MNFLRASGLFSLIAFAAACAPSTYDNITGGDGNKNEPITPRSTDVTDDPTLPAPRQISPLSVSWVNTARPKFRWELPPATTGALVELSQKRDFSGEIRSFVATGSELVVPEDLAPGIWFWRLRSRTLDNKQGVAKPEATVWEVLVRGPSKTGSSDVPNGSMFDMDGDGEPELSFSGELTEPGMPNYGWSYILFGMPDHTFTFGSTVKMQLEAPAGAYDLGVATGDFDGDGYTDILATDLWTDPEAPTNVFPETFLTYGGPKGFDGPKSEELGYVQMAHYTKMPSIQSVGDINGDGYGDIGLSLEGQSFTTLGSMWGPGGAMMMLPRPLEPDNLMRPFVGACDLDGDGISDIVMSSINPSSPVTYIHGSAERLDSFTNLAVQIGTPPRATALTAGDFDGNGVTEMAFTTVIDGTPAVCAYTHNTGPLTSDHCWKADGVAIEGFGQSLIAGDLDADGKDEIIVASTSGLTVLTKKEGAPGFDAAPIAGAFSSHLSMIYPGRPGPARWAAIATDAKSITVFSGNAPSHTLAVSSDPELVKFGPQLR